VCAGRSLGVAFNASTWERGRRGWGTGPQFHTDPNNGNPIVRPLISFFQQNPDNISIEAAADMFLNWVYRFNAQNGDSPTNSCGLEDLPHPTNWAGPGFLNQDWTTPLSGFTTDGAGLVPGSLDFSVPGDARYFYMDNLICGILSNNLCP